MNLKFHIIPSGIRLLSFVICLLCITGLNAQKFGASIEFGHQFGINGLKNNDLPFRSEKKYSLASGISRQLMLHVYPDSSNWYVSAGFNHLGGNPVVTGLIRDTGTYYRAATATLNSLRFITRISYVTAVRTFKVNVSAGVILPLLSSAQEQYDVRDSSGESVTILKVKHYPSFGFNGSVGLSTSVTSGIRFFLNADVNILHHSVKSRKVDSYSGTKGLSIEEVYPDVASRETVYHKDVTEIRNNRDVLPARFNKNQATDRLAYRVSDNSISIQAGFLFLF